MDLNHDGVRDFALHSSSGVTSCGDRGGLGGFARITPSTGNGVVVSVGDSAAVLPKGVPIDDTATFYHAQAIVTSFLLCVEGQHIQVAGYLGLEVLIDGQMHYGWAQISIYASFGSSMRNSMTTTLVGFAYETIPGQSINTGQTSGVASNAQPAINLPDYWAHGGMGTMPIRLLRFRSDSWDPLKQVYEQFPG